MSFSYFACRQVMPTPTVISSSASNFKYISTNELHPNLILWWAFSPPFHWPRRSSYSSFICVRCVAGRPSDSAKRVFLFKILSACPLRCLGQNCICGVSRTEKLLNEWRAQYVFVGSPPKGTWYCFHTRASLARSSWKLFQSGRLLRTAHKGTLLDTRALIPHLPSAMWLVSWISPDSSRGTFRIVAYPTISVNNAPYSDDAHECYGMLEQVHTLISPSNVKPKFGPEHLTMTKIEITIGPRSRPMIS